MSVHADLPPPPPPPTACNGRADGTLQQPQRRDQGTDHPCGSRQRQAELPGRRQPGEPGLGALGRPGGQQQLAVLVMKAPAGLREDLRGECRQIIEGRVRQELSLPLIAELAAVYLLPDGQYDIRTGHAPGARRAPGRLAGCQAVIRYPLKLRASRTRDRLGVLP